MRFLTTEMIVMDKTTEEDKEFGGIITVWKEGAHFMGTLVAKNSTEVRIAQQQGAKALYTLVTDKKIMLTRDMMVRRASDAADFRVTADSIDMKAPDFSAIQYAQCPVERVVL